jgi:ATP-dependent RNA helicase DHX37/DHR1
MPKFVPRQRKRRTLDKLRASAATPVDTGTAEIIVPVSQTEREERRAKLKAEVAAQYAGSKVSRQKQKRLDKYIENKLQKEENADLLTKIVTAQNGVDRSLLKSMKMLGRGREERREMMERAVKEREGGINIKEAEQILFTKRRAPKEQVSESEEESASEAEVSAPVQPLKSNVFGSALKRPLELDEEGRPVLKKRKREKAKGFKIDLQAPIVPSFEGSDEDEENEWDGFDSENERPANGVSWDDIGRSEDEDSEREPEDEQDYEQENDITDEGEEGSGETGSEGPESDDSESDNDEDTKAKSKERTSAFKAWADQARNEAIGFTPSNALSEVQTTENINFVPRPKEEDPLPQELMIKEGRKRRAYAVDVQRSEELQTTRLALPVVAKEQEIMEAVFNNDVVIISGATGSGKTTQVPQFLYENGFGDPEGPTPGLVGITQPRRVAAVSMAKRVSDELGNHKDRVAHQIRFDTTVSKKTALKFMTDGVLLREMADDFALKRYSAIIIDEAHERTVNTDILISLMSRCIKARAQLAKEKPKTYTPLKLIIMSATLRVSDFRENSRLFNEPPPLVQAEGRQFDVTTHWARKTHPDFVEEAFKKVSRGHRKLPPGGILVFLTGQNEIRMLAKRLKQTFTSTEALLEKNVRVNISAADMAIEPEDMENLESNDHIHDSDLTDEEELDSDVEIDGLDEQDSEFKIEGEEAGELMKVHVLPLYSQLPSKEQLRVFETPPDGSRLIVLATNVAETSLTIPGIRYVFDSGRVKERKWDRAGVQTFTTTWVSKASADQRTGRAGRTGPGHCYRLYSSAIYEGFEEFAEPEIFRSPLEGVVLQLKALNITKIENFPFPTPPQQSNISKAETLLCHLGALDLKKRITPVGRELRNYPLSPRFAQMLRLGQLYKCVDFAIATVAALDVPEVIIPEGFLGLHAQTNAEAEERTAASRFEDQQKESTRKAYGAAQGHLSKLSSVSDAMKLLMAVVTYTEADDAEAACEQYFLRSKALKEANQLREQLTNIVNNVKAGGIRKYNPVLSTPSETEVGLLRQIIAAGFVDQVAIRADCLPSPPDVERKPKRAIDVRYQTLIPSYDAAEVTSEDGKYVYLHPSSLLSRTAASKVPRYVVYQRLQRSQSSREGSMAKTRMHPLTPVSGAQLAVLARGTTLLSVGKPIGKIQVLPFVEGKERRQCSVVVSLTGQSGSIGWPLLRKEVIQRREPGEGWVVEKYLD